MMIKPLPDNVVIKACEVAETTKSGIVLASAAKEKSQIAEVVAVSEYGFLNGETVEMPVKVGDKVVAAKYAGTEIKLDGVDYIIVRLSDILAVVE